MLEQLNSKNNENKMKQNTVAKVGSIQYMISYCITNNENKILDREKVQLKVLLYQL